MKYCFLKYIILLFCLMSCSENKKQEVTRIMKEWNGKEILFPEKVKFTFYGNEYVYDTIPRTEYKIVTYIDSLGCASCKLRLSSWQNLIQQLDSMNLNIPILFFLHPFDARSLKAILRRDNFKYPVCMDINDEMNKLNHFLTDINYQTFLLDKNNKIVAIGNPVHNPKIKELFLNIILSNDRRVLQNNETTVAVQSSLIDFNTFEQAPRDTTIYIKNIGIENLIVLDIIASCGCTLVDYDKRPILPSDSLALKIRYNPDKKGYFNKTINVYCNTAVSPIKFHVQGVVD